MSKVELHDTRECYIASGNLNTGAGVTTWYFASPIAGYLDRAIFVSETAQTTADALLTFAIGTVDLAPTLTIPSSGGANGRSHVVRFSRSAGNVLLEPEHLDLVAAGGVIAVDTDGGGEGIGIIVMVIKP